MVAFNIENITHTRESFGHRFVAIVWHGFKSNFHRCHRRVWSPATEKGFLPINKERKENKRSKFGKIWWWGLRKFVFILFCQKVQILRSFNWLNWAFVRRKQKQRCQMVDNKSIRKQKQRCQTFEIWHTLAFAGTDVR